MPELAFFPWLKLDEEYVFDEHKLIPCRIGRDNKHGFPEAIHKVLEPYKDSHNGSLTHFVLFQFKDKQIIDDFDDNEKKEIFILKEIIAFALLAKRKYFQQSNNYINYNATDLYIQKVTENSDFVGVYLRRRDVCRNGLTDKKGVHFYCPPHVQTTLSKIDKEFVTSLFNVSKSDAWKSYEEAIFSYNLANTDSPAIMEQTELVLLCGAFERGLELRRKKANAENVSEAFKKIFENFPENKFVSDSPRSIAEPKGNKCLRKAWAYDFYTTRNELGHGKYKVGEDKQTRWDIKEHLLLATYILPLVIKIKLSNDNKYELSEDDKNSIHAIDYLLAAPNLFEAVDKSLNKDCFQMKNPWQTALNESQSKIGADETRKLIEKTIAEWQYM
jgi:hypothetical protein